MSAELRYSRVNSTRNKAHVFDHNKGKTICSLKAEFLKRPNKIKLKWKDILINHKGIAIRRQGTNHYKFCCIKCLKILESHSKGFNK